MTQNRYFILANTNTEDRHRNRGKLHKKELKRGWHYCYELDGALSTRTLYCKCHKYGNPKRERIRRSYKKRMRKFFIRWKTGDICDLADATSY